jgi:cytochrome c oxidase cbb3-type subunit 1
VQQATMLNATNPDGSLHYSFIETLIELYPLWYIRAAGGLIYLSSMLIFLYNMWKTVSGAQARGTAQQA